MNKNSALLIQDIHFGPTPGNRQSIDIQYLSCQQQAGAPDQRSDHGHSKYIDSGKTERFKKFSASLTVSRDLSLLTVNPQPQTIAGFDGSMRTTDEMLQLIISHLVYQQGDEEISLEDVS